MKNIKFHQCGFSIIELMVALLLSAILLFGVLQIFDTNSQTARVANAFSRVQESGRIATEMLARDIRMADYWGCALDSSSVSDHLNHDTKTGYEPWMNLRNSPGIAGEDNLPSGQTVGTIPVKEGSDKLTLRGAARWPGVKIVDPYMVVSSARIHVSASEGIPQGEVLLISDCSGADLFVNTNNTGGINHNTGTVTDGPENAVKNLSHTYGGNAQILRPTVKTYFVGQPESGVWSLYREHNGQISELVRDIEDMQIVYGEDTSDDGSVNAFSDAGGMTASQMNNVISIRVTIVASSANSASGSPVTRSYSITSNIRNRSL